MINFIKKDWKKKKIEKYNKKKNIKNKIEK